MQWIIIIGMYIEFTVQYSSVIEMIIMVAILHDQ